jgi:hypothetical protein
MGLPHCLFVCLRRTYSDVEGLEGQCLRCPGDKNYTIVKARLNPHCLQCVQVAIAFVRSAVLRSI